MNERNDRIHAISLSDLESIRLLLFGQSVIDWHHLSFVTEQEIDRFLRVNEFDPSSEEDMQRLDRIRQDAIEYLTRHLDYRIPSQLVDGISLKDLFFLASRRDKNQRYACMILKVMHVMHHLEGRESLFRLPVSNDQVFGLVENKVMQVVEEIRAAGHPIVEFAWSRKEYNSLITKLLAKRESIAAHVYDKLRFRLVVRDKKDIAPLLSEMLHRLVPYNYIIPGQTVNSLVSFPDVISSSPHLGVYESVLQTGHSDAGTNGDGQNFFSSPSYRVLNFIADLPIRVSSVVGKMDPSIPCPPSVDPRGVIFVLTEFQVVDLETERSNDQSQNSHRAYKDRQLGMVRARLNRGFDMG